MIPINFLVLLLVACLSTTAMAEEFEIQPYAQSEFNPKRKKAFEFEIKISSKSNVAVYIGTADKDPVKILATPKKYKKGIYKFIWDGKDGKKQKVHIPEERDRPFRLKMTAHSAST